MMLLLSISHVFAYHLKRYPGEGFDSATKMYRQACVTQDINSLYYAGQNTADIHYYFDQSHDQLAKNLHTKGTAALNGWVISGEVSASLDRDYASDDLSLSLTYENVLQGKTAIVDTPMMTQEGFLATQETSFKKRETCGDQFISAIHLGARFFINAKFIFRNEETKYHFKSDVTIKVAWSTFTKNLIDESLHSYQNDVAIMVTANQFGGDQNAFDLFLKKLGPSPSCSLNNLQPCQKYFQALLVYSQNDFLQQLDGMHYSAEDDRGPVALFYDHSSYERFGFQTLATHIDSNDPQIQQARLAKDAFLELQARLDQEFEDHQRASQLILHQKIFLLTREQVKNLQEIANKTNYNLTNLLLKAKENCLLSMKTCVQEKNITFAKLIPYHRTALTPSKA